ncbi:MAG TPA: RbsD/FucU family protein, partial [Candidatus Hydrogenedentes bacterium]|nr:RbsD/FucU family protein [Candidatus Hydrogenedentota bacterium]
VAGAGHGSRILITDANYPASTMLGENAQLVYLNLAPGLVTVIDVLKVLTAVVPIEEAAVMEPSEGPEPEIFAEFRAYLPGVPIVGYDRFQFYEEASGSDTCLQIVTGEQRIYANLLLTIGVVMP